MDEKKTKKEIKNIFSKAKETGIKLDDFLLFILNYLLYLYLVVYHNEEFDSLKKNGKNDIGIIPELTFIINDDWTKIDLSVIKKKGEEQGKAIDSLFVNYFTIFMKIVYSNLDKLKIFSGPLDLENKLKVLREQDLEKQNVYVNVFKKLPQEEFKHKADIAKCFDLVIDVFVNSFNKLGPVYYSSSNYREVLKKFGYYEDVKSVYDNCVGLGNLFDLTKDIACYGQDINPELVKICRIKLFINEKDHKNNENKNYENIKTWDTLLSDGLKEKKVDLAFSECPWGRGINKVNKDDERFCIF